MIDRCASRIDSRAQASAVTRSPSATRAASTGWARRSTMAHPSAAKRLDIDATWMRATSPATPRTATSEGSSAQAAARRANRGCPGSLPGSPSSEWPTWTATSSRAVTSAALPDATTADMASGCTKASEPSSVSKAATRASNRSPEAAPGPPHEARPTRWPSRRVRWNTSIVPSVPSSSTVASSARSTLARKRLTSSRPNSWWGRVRRPRNTSSGSLRRSIRQSATPLLARSSGRA